MIARGIRIDTEIDQEACQEVEAGAEVIAVEVAVEACHEVEVHRGNIVDGTASHHLPEEIHPEDAVMVVVVVVVVMVVVVLLELGMVVEGGEVLATALMAVVRKAEAEVGIGEEVQAGKGTGEDDEQVHSPFRGIYQAIG